MKIPTRPKRRFVSENIIIDSWEKLKPIYEDLANRKIKSSNYL